MYANSAQQALAIPKPSQAEAKAERESAESRKLNVKRQINNQIGGRFNFILHSKSRAHDLLSQCWHLSVVVVVVVHG